MTRFTHLLLVFALTGTTLHAADPPVGSPLVVEGLGKGTVALDGEWQFRVGDDPAWSSPTLDEIGWEHLHVDRPWGDQGHYGYTGIAWYRRHIDFVQNTGSPVEVVLYMPHVRCAYEVFWNGRLVGHFGSLPAKHRANCDAPFVGTLFCVFALTTYYSTVNAYAIPIVLGVALSEVKRAENPLRLYWFPVSTRTRLTGRHVESDKGA